jgi:LPS sulfotransferase NodH
MKKMQSSFLGNQTISNHEKIIIEFFGGYDAVAADIDKCIEEIRDGRELPATETVVICFTNRSGSNLLAEGIEKNSNAALGGEYFNHPMVANFCRKKNISSFSEYCIRLQKHLLRMKKKHIFCTKLGQVQLHFLTKMKVLPYLLPNPKFVLIKRKDILGQAVSFSIANQTSKWKSGQEGTGKRAVFKEADIIKRVEVLVKANASFEQYFALTGEECVQVYYEDLVDNFSGTLSKVIADLGLDLVATPDYSAVSLKRQRTSINQEFFDRVRRSCSLYGNDTPG